MAKTLDQKKKELHIIKDNLQKAKSVVFADFKGIPTESLNKLKNTLIAKNSTFAVYKNTLIEKAINGLKLPTVTLSGPTALVYSFEDALTAIKELFKAQKEGLALEIRQAFLEGRLLNTAEVEQVSKLPNREQLLGQVLSGFNAPLVGFTGSLAGVQRKFLYAINSLKEKKV
ncbi:50S ribosomal protein L10 [Candidatus Parcubacteria bacterium]|nr:50S ribosomal protein L10 [Patescibacteria group bacterium]MBU4380978.1 50S ribosomal protein L10 [Patescibacteria group bacterium]MCG2689391.1 50S ribosomal protein L10 [Candidatus Parcubacteria bacterium]